MDIVDELRDAFDRVRYGGEGPYIPEGDLLDVAAAEIERLRAELSDAREQAELWRRSEDTCRKHHYRLAAELSARDGQIAEWLRGWAYERWCVSDDDGETWLTGAADGVEAGAYKGESK